MGKLKLDNHQQAIVASFTLKEFQRLGIFANVDSCVYHLTGNTLSIDLIDTRAPNPPSSWIRKMITRDGFSKDMRIECDADADDSTASIVSEALETSSANPPMSLNGTNQSSQMKEMMVCHGECREATDRNLSRVTVSTRDRSMSRNEGQEPIEQIENPLVRKLPEAGPSSADQPILCSTPELPMDSRAVDILNKLDEVQGICSNTIGEVESLKEDWASRDAEILALKVIFLILIKIELQIFHLICLYSQTKKENHKSFHKLNLICFETHFYINQMESLKVSDLDNVQAFL